MGATDRRHSRFKQTWLRVLQAGAGSLIIAAAVVGAPPAKAATPPEPSSIEERLQRAREALRPGLPAIDQEKGRLDELTFWGNRWGNIGLGVRPAWPNWPNWNNWHNWGNGPWGNF